VLIGFSIATFFVVFIELANFLLTLNTENESRSKKNVRVYIKFFVFLFVMFGLLVMTYYLFLSVLELQKVFVWNNEKLVLESSEVIDMISGAFSFYIGGVKVTLWAMFSLIILSGIGFCISISHDKLIQTKQNKIEKTKGQMINRNKLIRKKEGKRKKLKRYSVKKRTTETLF